MTDEHLVPEVIKNIGQSFNPNNKTTNSNEKFQAEARLSAIIKYCEKALLVKKIK